MNIYQNIYYVYVENSADYYVTEIIERYFFSKITTARRKEADLKDKYKDDGESQVVFEVVELIKD